MRTIPFREVLWAIAYKVGLNPAQEFLADEGESLASYINAWVRRTWDAQDFPEWTTIKEFAPNEQHQVPYNTFTADLSFPVLLSRPLKVYLVDPRLSPYPIDTPFREWDAGLHVGFDHGATVWIKYLGEAPRFTSIPWDSASTYSEGDLVYSPDAGECFKSLVDGNTGIDPTDQAKLRIPLTVEVPVPFAPGSPGTPTIPEIWSVPVDLFELYERDAQVYSINFLDGTGAAHTLSYTTPADGGTAEDVLDGLIAAGAASGDSWITALALSKDVPDSALIITLATDSFTVSDATVTSPDEPVTGDDGLAVTGDDALPVIAGP